MRFCPYDQTPLSTPFAFCPSCGTSIAQLQAHISSTAQSAVPVRSSLQAPQPPTQVITDPFSMSVQWEHQCYPEGEDSLVRGVLRACSQEGLDVKQVRFESHLLLLLDISGSMNQRDKYPLLRRALELMLHNLEEGLLLTVVLFSSRAEVLCEAISAQKARSCAHALLQRMDSSPIRFQGTCIHDALVYAIAAARRVLKVRPEVLPRLYMLTDGEIADVEHAHTHTATLQALEIEVGSYGFGAHFSLEGVRRIMGDCMGGAVKHISDTKVAEEVFSRMVEVTSQIVASHGRLELTFAPDAIVGDFFAHRPRRRFWSQDTMMHTIFPVGNLEAQREYEWAFEARLPDEAPLGYKLAKVTLHYRFGGRAQQQSWDLLAPFHHSTQAGTYNRYVGNVFQSLEELRADGSDVRISALDARIAIAHLEGRDADFISNMERVKDMLERGISPELHDPDANRAAMADCMTCACVISTPVPNAGQTQGIPSGF